MNKLTRFMKHISSGRRQVARRFPKHSMERITTAIAQSESSHMGELRFAVEAGLDWPELLAGITPRQRALQVFSNLRIWDTEHNSGVLIYLLLAERKVEIVADRGIHARVGNTGWEHICRDMERQFRKGEFEEGILQGISAITKLLQQNFPAQQVNHNELPDEPVVL